MEAWVSSPVRFTSILFERSADAVEQAETSFFTDLNLDQVFTAVTAGLDEYDLAPFFGIPLHSERAVAYRHDVLRDLEHDAVSAAVAGFAEQMREMRRHLAQAGKLRFRYQKEHWFLDAASIYCDATSTLADALAATELHSRGFIAFRDYLVAYTRSRRFTDLVAEIRRVASALATVRYCVNVKGGRVRVTRFNAEADYSAEVVQTFAKFARGAVKDYRVAFRSLVDMNHLEERILGLVARLYPDEFGALDDFCARHAGYLDETIRLFDREIQFYVAYLKFTAPMKVAGLDFCYPAVSTASKEVSATAAFDLALAGKLVPEASVVVRNDFYLTGPERIFVVTGPNQGGKTTFARMFGQLHYLAALGYPVPARQARLFLPDQVFTHFETGRGSGDAARQVRGRADPDPQRPGAGDRGQRGGHERELRLHHAAGCREYRRAGTGPDDPPGPAGRLCHVRRRAGVAERRVRQHGGHSGAGQPGGADLPGGPAARRRPGLRRRDRGQIRPHLPAA